MVDSHDENTDTVKKMLKKNVLVDHPFLSYH